MTLGNFRAAVRSLADWHGVIGMFGGNCCLHPQFPELCAIFREEIPDKRRRGLWSNNVYKHAEVCKQTFGYWNINVHGDSSLGMKMKAEGIPVIPSSMLRQAMHSPVFTAIKDFVKDEDEMWNLIESCEINQRWSGAIAQRGDTIKAYLCEVQAAFDNAYGEDHGVAVEPGWWKWRADKFDAQVKRWCVNCGVPLKKIGQKDCSETDDISVTHVALTANGKRLQVMHESDNMAGVDHPTDYQRLQRV